MGDASEQRKSDRSAIALGARCRTEIGTRHFVALVDLTTDGCCVFMEPPCLSQNQHVSLAPEAMASFSARVQWSKGCLAGLQFEHPLYEPVYEHLARTFARPMHPSLQSALQQEGGRPARMPDDLRRELLLRIEVAEAKYHDRPDKRLSSYLRISNTSARPGLGTKPVIKKPVELFLG